MFNLKLLLFFCFSACVSAQFDYKIYSNNKDTIPYRIIVPKNYSSEKSYPILIFLHGSGERGNNNESQLIHGSKVMGSDNFQKQHGSFVVFPQKVTNQINRSDACKPCYNSVGSEAGSPSLSWRNLSAILSPWRRRDLPLKSGRPRHPTLSTEPT